MKKKKETETMIAWYMPKSLTMKYHGMCIFRQALKILEVRTGLLSAIK